MKILKTDYKFKKLKKGKNPLDPRDLAKRCSGSPKYKLYRNSKIAQILH